MRKLALIGSGRHARETIEAARAAGDDVVALIDEFEESWGGDVLGVSVASGGLEAVRTLNPETELVIAIGHNDARARLAERLSGRRFATVIHPFSWISPTAEIGAGSMIFAGAVVQTQARLGRHVILNTGATVSHDVVAGDCCHIAVGAHLAGNVELGEGVMIGAGVAARPGAKVGAWATVGAGAAIIRDIPSGATAFGESNARVRD